MPCDDFRLDLAAEFGIIHESADTGHKGSPLATRHSMRKINLNLPICVENLEYNIHYMYAY